MKNLQSGCDTFGLRRQYNLLKMATLTVDIGADLDDESFRDDERRNDELNIAADTLYRLGCATPINIRSRLQGLLTTDGPLRILKKMQQELDERGIQSSIKK